LRASVVFRERFLPVGASFRSLSVRLDVLNQWEQSFFAQIAELLSFERGHAFQF
jgi:hypothetical protein